MSQLQIGEQLRQLRKAQGLTTQELADKVNVSQSYISRFENDNAIPDVVMLERILLALNSNLSSFFSKDLDDAPLDLIQLINTVKTLSPEARTKLNDFLILVADSRKN